MQNHGLAIALIIAAAVLVGVLPATGQTTTSQPNEWTVPRTPDGHPDLQGVWDFRTITPLERPLELSGKEFLTEEEAAVYERETLSSRNADRRDRDQSREGFVNGAPVTADLARAYNQFWFDRGTSVSRRGQTHVAHCGSTGRKDSSVDTRCRDASGCA